MKKIFKKLLFVYFYYIKLYDYEVFKINEKPIYILRRGQKEFIFDI